MNNHNSMPATGDLVIAVDAISKAYRIWETPTARLTAPLQESLAKVLPAGAGAALRRRAGRQYRDFHALKDISFELRKGECIGIIGRNGSGKSTLLQIIAGTLQPTSGRVNSSGRVAALLELGTGFNPEFTGRENVFLNGIILGLTQAEIEAKYNAIAAFADIGDFMDQPVKSYSSGMTMRLAFAVQTAVEPDILIVDEALSVGDAPFQAKCFARIRTLQESGCTILFVSHDVTSVLTLCSSAILLSSGRTISQGTAKKVCDDYQLLCLEERGIATPLPITAGSDQARFLERAEAYVSKGNPEFEKNARSQRAGNGALKLIDCYIEDLSGKRLSLVEYNQEVVICWLLQSHEKITAAIALSFTAKSLRGQSLISGTDKRSNLILNLDAGQIVSARMSYRFPLKSDHYYLTTSLFAFPPGRKFVNEMINFDEAVLLDLVEYSCYFEINWDRRWCHYGPVQLDGTMELISLNP